MPSTRLRELVRAALDAARARRRSTRCRPSSSCRSGATRSRRSTSPSTRARPSRPGGGSRFDELLALQLAVAALAGRGRAGRPLPPPGELVARYRAALPFELTEHQERAIAEIDRDLARDAPMQRLLQGDVGSGKTVVALYALLRAVEAGRQGALMAPTETLAEQHFLTVEALCAELGVRVVLLTGSAGAAKARAARSSRGAAQIAVGTHALIQRGRRVRRPRGRGRRRAAPLRRRAAPGARRGCGRTCCT